METSAVFPVSHSRKRLFADLLLLVIAAVWGGTFFMVKDVTAIFPVLPFLALRFGIASLALLPFAMYTKRWPTHQEWQWGILAGLAFCVGYIFQTFSLRMIDSGRTGFITGLYVILVPILAFVLLRHRPSKRVMAGTVLAFVGLVLLSYAPGGNFLGDLLAFSCALSYAVQIIIVEKFPKTARWQLMSIIQSACVSICCALLAPLMAAMQHCTLALCVSLAPFADPLPTSVPLVALVVAGFTGMIATGAGLAIQVWAQRHIPPSDAALAFAMESPFSAIFGVLFRGEVLTFSGLIGCAMILAGMLITSLSMEKAKMRERGNSVVVKLSDWKRRTSEFLTRDPVPEPPSGDQ